MAFMDLCTHYFSIQGLLAAAAALEAAAAAAEAGPPALGL